MRILVTGANGHLGQACVRDLIENGYGVRASVRNIKNPQQTMGLSDFDIEIVEADLFDQNSLNNACEGCDGVFQLAATYKFFEVSDTREMIKTGTEGVKNLLKAASKTGIRRVVVTSSVVAIGATTRGNPPANEKAWNKDLEIPYFREKTEGERIARATAKRYCLDLVTVCPGIVLGPFFTKNTPSIDNIEAIAKGALRLGAPDIWLGLVDVRDVATAHRLSFEKGTTGGRYVAVEKNYSMFDIANYLNKVDPKIKIPLLKIPKSLTALIPFFDLLNSKIFNYPRTINQNMANLFRYKDLIFNGDATRSDIGWEPKINIEDSLAATLHTLRLNGRY